MYKNTRGELEEMEKWIDERNSKMLDEIGKKKKITLEETLQRTKKGPKDQVLGQKR